MPHKSLLLAVTLSALLVTSGAFWLMQRRQIALLQPIVTTLPVEPPVQTEVKDSIDTSHWQTYRNEKYGFEIKYPGDIYQVEDGGYVTLISFVARNQKLKELYGDIQVLYMDGEGNPFDEKEVAKFTRTINLGGKEIYLDESRSGCAEGVADGYCDVPGSAYIFFGDRSYNIRRITFRGMQFPPVLENNFVQFLTEFKVLPL